MRMQSGITDQVIYFVAYDSTDHITRKTGLSSFTVYRSRNGGSATAYTTPTITEVSSANMPGVYKFLLDEDMTIDSGDDSQEMVFHITATGMDPVTRAIELYRPVVTAGTTLTVTSGVASANTTQLAGQTVSASGTVTFPNATLASTTNVTAGTITTVSGNVTGNVGGNVGGNVTGSVGSLATQAKADVNAEVLDVLNVDTFAQPGQGTPAATTSIRLMLAYLYKAWRNKKTQTATQTSYYNDDAATVDHKSTCSDDGTTFTSGEVATGP